MKEASDLTKITSGVTRTVSKVGVNFLPLSVEPRYQLRLFYESVFLDEKPQYRSNGSKYRLQAPFSEFYGGITFFGKVGDFLDFRSRSEVWFGVYQSASAKNLYSL